MVMEAPPSPDSVGREFVRQYYTLLNKAPTHLHRFYNNQSSFVHGGLDPPHRETSPMIGQKQIHQKIQQLNFQDCHAKITQVDAQATLGNGVVVQVTGELSNAGQPMRRFTQTFVLAAQSPKKYYVHNDIFRYQDVIYSDEEGENEPRSDTEDEGIVSGNGGGQERPVLGDMPPIAQQPMTYYSPSAAQIPGGMPPVAPHHHAQPAPHVMAPQPSMPAVNGAVHPDELGVISGTMPPHVAAATIIPASISPPQVPVMSPPVLIEEIPQPIEEGSGDSMEICTEPPMEMEQNDIPSEPVANEPKTYATLLKSGGGIGGYAAVTQMNVTQCIPLKSISPPPQNRFDNRMGGPPGQGQQKNRSDNNMRNNQRPGGQPGQRTPRQDTRGGPPRNSFNEDGNNFEERRRSQGYFNDSNQLFLGSLPHSATEEELREIFGQFGLISDLKIHSKSNNKPGPPGQRAPANYGFITFDNQAAVQNCLAAKPITYPAGDKNGMVLNVEEKRMKDRQPYNPSGRVGIDGGMGPRPRDLNGPRRGPPGSGLAGGQPRGPGGPMGGPGTGGGGSGGGNRPNNFNRGGPPNRGPNNTYTNRR